MSETVLSPAKQELLLRLRGAAHASPGGPVPLRGGTGSPTLVLVYPVGGALFCYAALTAALETSSPVYGFADAGELAGEAPEQRIPRLAAWYLAELGEAEVPRPRVLGDSPDTSGDWAPFVSGPIDRHVVPGDHYDLLFGAAAARVARVVGEVLRR